jgi:hypothetical protein
MQLLHALARVMAAAPDAAARDGRQALSIAQRLETAMGDKKTTQLGETLAMAYAEAGNFAEAVAVQRSVLNATARAGLNPDVRRMTSNLRLYESGQACRTPWQANEDVFAPGPPISPDLAAVLASAPPARSAGN